MEKIAESMLYASRWILAPIYMGLSLALVLLALKFFQELVHYFPLVLNSSEADLVLVVLSLIDMALVGGLLVMVMFSGCENFVSRIDKLTRRQYISYSAKACLFAARHQNAALVILKQVLITQPAGRHALA